MSSRQFEQADSAHDPSQSVALMQLGLVCVAIGVLTWASNLYFQNKSKKAKKEESDEEPVDLQMTEPQNTTVRNRKNKKSNAAKAATKQAGQLKFDHEDVVGLLKQSGQVLDFSFSTNGKYLVSIGEDRSVIMWSTKEFDMKGTRNTVKGRVDLDNPITVDFAPDSRSIAIGLELTSSVKIMKVAKKDDSSEVTLQDAVELPKILENDLLKASISPSQTYIMICDDVENIYVLDLKGNVLGKVDSKTGGAIRQCEVSPCGRFVAYCGKDKVELPVFEIDFSSTNVFRGIKKAMILKGHSRPIASFAFSLDAASMATVGTDNCWRVHSIDVRYKDQEEPKCIASGTFQGLDGDAAKCFLSFNGKLLGIYDENSLQLTCVTTGEVLVSYSGLASHTPIVKCLTDNLSKHVVVAVGKGMVVLRNKYQHKATIEWLKQELQKSGSPQMKVRLQQQLDEEQQKLEALEPKEEEEE